MFHVAIYITSEKEDGRPKELNTELQLAGSDWLIIASLSIGLYWALISKLSSSDLMKRHNITTWGPVIMIRSTRGLGLIDWLSRPKKIWRIGASAGIPLVITGMMYFLILLILLNFAMLRSPPEPSSYTAPRNILLIPGINQFIPFVWGWIALFVTLLVHEFAHGILARVEGIRVKSLGLALAPIPIAAFVEPDEEELFGTKEKEAKASRNARVRILAAGVIANFVVAAIAFAIFFGPVIGAIAPMDRIVVVDVKPGSAGDFANFEDQMILLEVNGKKVNYLDSLYSALQSEQSAFKVINDNNGEDLFLSGTPIRGVLITSVFEEYPAKEAGMEGGVIITKLDDFPITGLQAFKDYMNTTSEGDEVAVTTNQGIYNIQLASRADGVGFMGVGISGSVVEMNGVTFQEFPARSFVTALQSIPHNWIGGFITLLGLPFTGIPGFTEMGFPGFSGWISNFFEPAGWAVPLGDKLFWLANLMLWIGLINLYAGLFNCLPAVPLDGGHIFRDLLHSATERLFRSEEMAERVTRTVVALMAWLILSSILFTVVAPYMAHGVTI